MASTSTLNVMHCSMEFSDNKAEKQADAKKIFARAHKHHTHWITGTEAGLGASADLRAALMKEAKNTGYNFTVQSDVWIAVNKDLITRGSWDMGFITTLQSDTGSQRFSDRGILWVEFDNSVLGTISIGCSHYMTHGQKPSDEYFGANTKLTRAIGEWGKIHGAGRAICFFGADSNIQDRSDDVFRGAPFTTLADELEDWQDTGHGAIDIIASYNGDGRVKGKYWRVLDDSEFKLNTDHFACEGGFEIGLPRKQ